MLTWGCLVLGPSEITGKLFSEVLMTFESSCRMNKRKSMGFGA